MKLSVVIATFNRTASLLRLLRQLEAQTFRDFEVCICDDGSAQPVEPAVREAKLHLSLQLHRQQNQGAAAARHAAAVRATGEVLVFIDDDMQVAPAYLMAHAEAHARNEHAIVLGPIAPDPSVELPLFERWHAEALEQLARDVAAGTVKLRGNHLFTGNASVRRSDYFAVGGFDASLPHSEDAELGLRLEASGCTVQFADDARVLHGSDHTSVEKFLKRAFTYGQCDTRIGRKHAEAPHADPWRFAQTLNPALKPLLAAALVAPEQTAAVSKALMATSNVCDRAGARKLALKLTTAVFAVQYFRGMRSEHGDLMKTTDGFLRNLARTSPLLAAARAQWNTLRQDHSVMCAQEKTYGHRTPSDGNLAADVVQKIGLQQVALLRTTRACRDAGLATAARALTRIGRHLYGSDIHWDAQLGEGLVLVHGFGLAISHAAVIGPNCVLSQNVTLGFGRDRTGKTGAPTLGANVRVGPGATLVGPITIGDNVKIGPGVVLTESVPANAVVEAAPAQVRMRARNEAKGSTAKRAAGGVADGTASAGQN